ncbi:hypothetical protein FDP13_14305 [Dickeya sp. ws52]|nr:hypothetical protein FDP13_14305 [Dickeya sp. ws52]
MWQSSNFLLLAHCFSAPGLVFNRTIILMREINIRQSPHIRISFLRHEAAGPDALLPQEQRARGITDLTRGKRTPFPLPHPGLS